MIYKKYYICLFGCLSICFVMYLSLDIFTNKKLKFKTLESKEDIQRNKTIGNDKVVKMISSVNIRTPKVEEFKKILENVSISKVAEVKTPKTFEEVIIQSVSIAKDIMMKYQLVLFTLINNAYLPFVYSWLCNTINMGINEQILFITTDLISKEKIEKDWPKVKVVAIPESSLSGAQDYSKVGYIKLMVKRTQILNALLQNNVETLLFEVDCLWVSNPIEECKKASLVNDMLVTSISNHKHAIAGGFLYMKPTNNMKKLWLKLTARMMQLSKEISVKNDKSFVSESKNDQVFLTDLIGRKYGGIKYRVLPWERYMDGKWYKMKLEDRKKKHVILINNNWIIGNKAKLERAKKFGHWFIDDSMKCNRKQVDRVVNQRLYV